LKKKQYFPIFVLFRIFMIRYRKDTDNIVVLTLDMKERQVNIINHEIGKSFVPVIEHLQAEKAKGLLRGVIITSAKNSFMAGGDIDFLYAANNPQEIFDYSQALAKFMRDIESPGVPVVAALNGSALGSGFELAMACHYRIAVNNPRIELGYPEVTYGIMPGSGGVIRMMWLLGIEKAFPILANGHRYSPTEALKIGMIDAVAEDEEDMIFQAKEWLLEHREGRRVWDTEDGKIPFGTASDQNIAEKIRFMAAELSKATFNNFLAPQAILNTLSEGSKVDFDTACRINGRYFTYLMCNKQSKDMIKAFWYDTTAIKIGETRPKGFGKFRPKKIGIIGAGKMGSAIAFSCAMNGLEVKLNDVSLSIAEIGRQYSLKKIANLVHSDYLTEEDALVFSERVTATTNFSDFKDCDLVIEAVYESREVKKKTIVDAEDFLDESAVFATNTTSIPISRLAKKSKRPENFVGIHFLHPADENPLVEIVKGEKTSDETVSRAFDFLKQIKKIPIIVKDYQGFFVSRVQNTFILEAITLLQEGFSSILIENLSLQVGLPMSGLALADEFSLPLIMEFESQAAEHYGDKYLEHPAVKVLQKMMSLKRDGKISKAGFYEYLPNGQQQLWSELGNLYPTNKENRYDEKAVVERLLFVQAIEAIWCLQEGVISSVAEANLGSVYGFGFPSYYGGVIQYVYSYGIQAFIDKCAVFEAQHGPRFKVPKWLKKQIL
jgi:3-hydroxyacyl-CoA dehydrogenase / enoyl-CoA hydratase / 3-hydroxybutyryl-CoA epimerase